MSTYHLRARSVIHPGNFLVEGLDGSCYVYFADVGELSVTRIEHGLAHAMMQSYEWSPLTDGDLVTLDELKAMVAPQIQPPAGDSGTAQSNR